MPVTVVGWGAVTSSKTQGATLTFSYPSGYSVTAGDLAIIVMGGWSDTDVWPNTPSGYAQGTKSTRTVTSPTLYLHCITFTKVLDGSESSAPTTTVPQTYSTGSGVQRALGGFIVILRDQNSSSAFDATAVASQSGAAATFQPTGITTATADARLLCFATSGDLNSINYNTQNGFDAGPPVSSNQQTPAGSLPSFCMAGASKAAGTAGAKTMPTWNESANGNDSWAALALAVKTAHVPGTPSAPTVTPDRVGGFTVSWSAPSNDDQSGITNYQVDYDSGGGWTTYGTTGNASTSMVCSGFGNGASVSFRVLAYNRLGWGSASSGQSGTTWNVPGTPTGLSAANQHDGTFYLSWTPPSDGGESIDDYVVQWALAGSGSWNTFSHGASSASNITVTGLDRYKSYDFRVAATNAVGTGSYSSTATGQGDANSYWGIRT